MGLLDVPAASHYFSAEHEQFRRSVRAWVAREIAPHVAAWDEAEGFPRELYRRAAALGLLGLGYPQALGGTDADIFYALIAAVVVTPTVSLVIAAGFHRVRGVGLRRRIAALPAPERADILATVRQEGGDVGKLAASLSRSFKVTEVAPAPAARG